MQEHIQLTQKEINEDLLVGLTKTPMWWWVSVAFFGAVFLAGVVASPVGAPNAVLLGSVLSLVVVGMIALRWRELVSFRGAD